MTLREVGLPANPTFTTVTATGAITGATTNGSTTDVTTSGTSIYGGQTVTVNPPSNSSAIVIAGFGKVTYTGSGDITGVGHIIGSLGWSVMNAAGRTAVLNIGLEGKCDVLAGTVTSVVSGEFQLSSNLGNINTWIGCDAQVVTNAAPLANAAAFRGLVAANTNTISIWAGLWLPDLSAIAGITTKYSLLSQDAAASASHAGAITITGTANGLTVNSATMLTTTTAFTNNAAASTATLTNSPTVGNPTKWIPINDNGTTRNIPAW